MVIGGRREGAVGSAWRPVRGRGRSGVLSDITHCALGFFFSCVGTNAPPPPVAIMPSALFTLPDLNSMDTD